MVFEHAEVTQKQRPLTKQLLRCTIINWSTGGLVKFVLFCACASLLRSFYTFK